LIRVLVPRECRPGETRVAATPETVRRLAARGCALQVERGAGQASGFEDDAYGEAGAELIEPATGALDFWREADVVLAVQAAALAEQRRELEALRPGALLLGLLEPHGNERLKQQLEQQRLTAMALELLPRISRAQTMDVLSSQANIAGYKAVLLASAALDRYVPMLMTAAGTIQPARALILGAGVAGLQALATARRLGAVAYVSDVRAAAKEQVESLGGRFIDPPELEQKPGETGGYAQQATEDFLAAQRRQLIEQLALADMVICTAQVPGRPAPRLIDDAMLQHMRPGSVVVDLAVAQGGNCEGTQPGTTVLRHGVQLIGADQLPCSVANHASALYARNVAALLEHLLAASGDEPSALQLDLEDPIVSGCLFTHHSTSGGAA
jgi:H+-translocating NAD(P) transhydrogenase subunit alpha